MPDSSVNTPSDDDLDLDFDFETEIELLDPKNFLASAGYTKINYFESGLWKFWPAKAEPEGWTELAVRFSQDIFTRWWVTLYASCMPASAPLAHRRHVANFYPQANLSLSKDSDAIEAIRSVVGAVETIFQANPNPTEVIRAFRALPKPLAESVVLAILDAEDGDDLVGDLDLSDMLEPQIQYLDIRSLRQAFRGLGYSVSAYRRLRWEKELCITGTPVNKAHRVTADDVQAVGRYYEEYFKNLPGFAVTVFGWNRKPAGPNVQDYEQTGLDKLYVTIRGVDINSPSHVDACGGLPFKDIQYESMDFENVDDLSDLIDLAFSGLATTENVRTVLEKAGYRNFFGGTYSKFIKYVSTGVSGQNDSKSVWVMVNLVNSKGIFVYIGYPRHDGPPVRIGMNNSWIKSLPNNLPVLLSELEAALARCKHTDDVLTFKARHPALVLKSLE